MTHHYEPNLIIDTEATLPNAGDKKRLRGGASVALEEGYELSFAPGEGVSWSLELRRLAGGIEITGTLSGYVPLQCHRCLETFDLPVSQEIREHALLAGGEVERGDDSGNEYLVENGSLDLLPVLRDAIALALPLKRVCSEKCRGFCPECGANLNLEDCGCPRKVVDPRLKPLEELKRRMGDSNG